MLEALCGTPWRSTPTVRDMPWLAMSVWFYPKRFLPERSSAVRIISHYEMLSLQGSVIKLQLVREEHFDATGTVVKDAAVPSPRLYRTVLGALAFGGAFGLLVLRCQRRAWAQTERA
jgi:hypothetical protein